MPKKTEQNTDATLVNRLNRRVRRSTARWRAEPPQPFGETLQLHRFTLGNGLRVRIVADRSAPVLSYHTWYRVGSRHETEGKTGLAHLFEHLMFNETRRIPYGHFDFLIESAGGESNASTWTDWTQYHAELPASELPMIAEIEAQRMGELVLRAPQVSSEKEVVANERRQRVDDDVEGLAGEMLYATAFRKHPYHWPTIGWMQDIEGFTPTDCERFYRRYYAPNNATIVIVGDVDLEQALRCVSRSYGHLKPARLPRERKITEPAQRSERVRELCWPTAAPKLLLGYRACGLSDPDFDVLTVLNDVMFGGRGSRLFRKLVRDREFLTELNGTIAPFRDPGLYEMWLSLRAGVAIDDVLSTVEQELTRLQHEPISVEELARSCNRLELSFVQSLETAAGKADQLGFYETVLGDGSQLFARAHSYKRVTPADVMRVARRYLKPTRRTRVHVLPAEEASA